MAYELQLAYNDSATLYAIIRRTSDNYVWNGSAFEVWSSGSIANYDVPLTDRGGDMYNADFPSAIAAGDYIVFYYLQSGGTAAITDNLIGRPTRRYWNGAVLSSSSSVTLSAYALATLAQVKQDLGITDGSSDTALTEDINAATAAIERALGGRKIVARNYRERADGMNHYRLRTKQFPIITITRQSYGESNAMSIAYSGSAIRAESAVFNDYSSSTSGGMRIASTATNGTLTTNNLLFADYPTVTLLAAAITAVSGWTATTITNIPSADLNPQVLGNNKSTTLYATYADQAWPDHTVNYQTGIIELRSPSPHFGINRRALPDWYQHDARDYVPEWRPVGFQGYLIEYRAGHEAVPDDLNHLCRELVRRHYFLRNLDPNVKAETLGPFSFTWGRDDEAFVRETLQSTGWIDYSACIA